MIKNLKISKKIKTFAPFIIAGTIAANAHINGDGIPFYQEYETAYAYDAYKINEGDLIKNTEYYTKINNTDSNNYLVLNSNEFYSLSKKVSKKDAKKILQNYKNQSFNEVESPDSANISWEYDDTKVLIRNKNMGTMDVLESSERNAKSTNEAMILLLSETLLALFAYYISLDNEELEDIEKKTKCKSR